MLKEVVETPFVWKNLQLLSSTEAQKDVHQLFSIPAGFLLGCLTSLWERKVAFENRMGNYRGKTDFRREERFLEDKEKMQRREEEEKRQECRSHL